MAHPWSSGPLSISQYFSASWVIPPLCQLLCSTSPMAVSPSAQDPYIHPWIFILIIALTSSLSHYPHFPNIFVIPSSSSSHHPRHPIILVIPSSSSSCHPHHPVILIILSSSSSCHPHHPVILICPVLLWSQPVILLSLCLIFPLISFSVSLIFLPLSTCPSSLSVI